MAVSGYLFVGEDGEPIRPKPVETPLYIAPSLGKVRGFLVDDDEVDLLRITAIRRCSAVLADLAKLQTRNWTVADALRGDAALRKRLVESVDFAAVEEIEKAMTRLESLLGADALVDEPRVEFGPGYCSLVAAREQVDALTAAMKDYRAMRAALK